MLARIILIAALSVCAAAQTPVIASITNGGSFQPALAPGCQASIFGSGFTPAPALAMAFPLPLTLGGVSITVNGVGAPLFFVSASQINFIIPFEVSPGPATLILTTSQGQKSAALSFTLLPYAPGLYSFSP